VKQISIGTENGMNNKHWIVLLCPCGHEESGDRIRWEDLGRAAVRMADHVKNCEVTP
jgi:hypothetical protein